MPRDDNTRFRITTWPSTPLPHPGHSSAVHYAFDEAAQAFGPDWETENVAPLPQIEGEAYLALAAISPDNVGGILDFLNTYGELGVRGQYTLSSWEWSALAMPRQDEVIPLAEALKRSNGGESDTLVEFEWAILLMRDLITALQIVRGERDHETAVWQCPLWEFRRHELESPPWAEEGPRSLLETTLGVSLETFTPRLSFQSGDGTAGPYSDLATAWHICCLEMFNHIVEAAPYKTCANETCGRLFVRQEGRAVHGQHRSTGVKYCSAECARAQAQRQYRRRKRGAG